MYDVWLLFYDPSVLSAFNIINFFTSSPMSWNHLGPLCLLYQPRPRNHSSSLPPGSHCNDWPCLFLQSIDTIVIFVSLHHFLANIISFPSSPFFCYLVKSSHGWIQSLAFSAPEPEMLTFAGGNSTVMWVEFILGFWAQVSTGHSLQHGDDSKFVFLISKILIS